MSRSDERVVKLVDVRCDSTEQATQKVRLALSAPKKDLGWC